MFYLYAIYLFKFMMKPYLQKNKNVTEEKHIFGYHLSRIRRISENGFEVLADR